MAAKALSKIGKHQLFKRESELPLAGVFFILESFLLCRCCKQRLLPELMMSANKLQTEYYSG